MYIILCMNFVHAKIISGCLGSCIISLITFPIDTIKSHHQTNKSLKPNNYYNGIKYDLSCEILSSATFFIIYEFNSTSKTQQSILYSSTLGSLCSSLVKTPFEFYKVKHQCMQPVPLLCISSIYRHFPLTLAKHAPTQIVTFSSIENMKANLKKFISTDEIPLQYTMMIGYIAGSLACIINNPIDVLKTKTIYNGCVYKSIHSMTEIGVSSLFLGLKCRLIMSGMNVGIGYSVYDKLSNMLIEH